MLKYMLPYRPITNKKKLGRPVGSTSFSDTRLRIKQNAMLKRNLTKYGAEYNKQLKEIGDVVPFGLVLAEQNHRCAICNREFSKTCKPVIDHCHDSLIVRGFLCNNCNVLLGMASDSTQVLKEAISYLKKYENLYKRFKAQKSLTKTERWRVHFVLK